MNERIKDLKQRAGIDFNPDQEGLDLFAELIVQECIDNVKIWEKDSRNHISYMLKHYFGVEE
jgi:hypothetical protein